MNKLYSSDSPSSDSDVSYMEEFSQEETPASQTVQDF